jgi:nucleotide-binding universal stress UspA family protein
MPGCNMFVIVNVEKGKQKMDNTILCTIDFSDSSRDVLKYAVNLSKQYNSHITVLYTYRLLNSLNGEVIDIRKKIEEQAKQNFSILEKEVLAGSGVSYDFKIEVGFVSNRVREYAKTNGVSFLVMGKKMNGSSRESFDELAENIHVPLVIVP